MEIEKISSRREQLKKETMISIALYVAYFLWWYGTGYGLAKGDPAQYRYIMGLPQWFFLSSIVGYVWFCIATILVTKIWFKNFSLDDEERTDA